MHIFNIHGVSLTERKGYDPKNLKRSEAKHFLNNTYNYYFIEFDIKYSVIHCIRIEQYVIWKIIRIH